MAVPRAHLLLKPHFSFMANEVAQQRWGTAAAALPLGLIPPKKLKMLQTQTADFNISADSSNPTEN